MGMRGAAYVPPCHLEGYHKMGENADAQAFRCCPPHRKLSGQGARCSAIHEVSQQVFADWGHDRLGVKLDTFHSELMMSDAHDFSFVRLSSDLQAGRQGLAPDHERVIACRRERVREMAKHPLTGMMDVRGLSVQNSIVPHDLATEQIGR